MKLKDYVQKALTWIKEAAPAGGTGSYQLAVEFDLNVVDREGELTVLNAEGGSRLRFKAVIETPRD